MRIIGVDLDGTLTISIFSNSDVEILQWLFFPLAPFYIFAAPNEKVAKMLKKMADKGDEIFIISARPLWAAWLTRWQVKRIGVPFSDVISVGFGRETDVRKLKAIRENKIEIFFDNEERTIEFLRRNSVRAILVNSHRKRRA